MPLKIQGVVLSCDSDTFEYKSKKTGNTEKMTRVSVVLQGDYGVIVGTMFNPSPDALAVVKQGAKAALVVAEYKTDNGVQIATLRVG